MRRHQILIPIAALLATLPLILHGCSCGHDFDFHLQSWLDAAQQLRHGILYPHWAFSAAYNSGEPRFLFYPPLSWLLGALLTIVFPIAATPAIYTFIALTAAGFAMHYLARHFTTPNAALLAAILYLANPYMLFNAFERTAYAELLAAAWIPLLLLAVLRKRPTVPGLAIPIALLWLTNAPAAVMGCYTVALLATLRLLLTLRSPQTMGTSDRNYENVGTPERSSAKAGAPDLSHLEIGVLASPQPPTETPVQLALTYIAGTALGLTLPAFYLIPAAYERRYVQIAMAIIPNMRFQDNFLFGHTADAPHNTVLHTASLLAVTLLALTFAATLILLLLKPRTSKLEAQSSQLEAGSDPLSSHLAPVLLLTTTLIAFLLLPISTPIWNHLPNLAFLQFPWRLLTILAAILAFTLALLFNLQPEEAAPDEVSHEEAAHNQVTHEQATYGQATYGQATTQVPRGFSLGSHTPGKKGALAPGVSLATTTILLAPLALTLLCIHLYRQPCDPADTPTAVAQSFTTHHGVAPTDEYTPNLADNDTLRANDPAYWLSTNPQAFAPNTTPNPAATDPTYNSDDPPADTLSANAPTHFILHTDKPEYLILNLRDYPNWDVSHTDPNSMELQRPPHIPRDDGLIAVPLYYGSTFYFDIAWHRTPDQQFGLAISVLACLALAYTLRRSRKLN